MTSRLTVGETASLDAIDAVLPYLPADGMQAKKTAATTVADALRKDISDIDDVTLARVLLHVGNFLGIIAARPFGLQTLASMPDVLGLTAAEMTRLERGEIPPA